MVLIRTFGLWAFYWYSFISETPIFKEVFLWYKRREIIEQGLYSKKQRYRGKKVHIIILCRNERKGGTLIKQEPWLVTEYTVSRLNRDKAVLTGLWSRNCVTAAQSTLDGNSKHFKTSQCD